VTVVEDLNLYTWIPILFYIHFGNCYPINGFVSLIVYILFLAL
jgi:hypothetical protein